MNLLSVLSFLGKHAEAAAIADELAALEPPKGFHYATVLNSLAWSRVMQQEQLEKAEEMARQALAITPRSGPCQGTLGAVLWSLNREEEALEALKVAVVRQAESMGVAINAYHLSHIMASRGQTDEAAEYEELARRCDPKGCAKRLVDDLVRANAR